MSENFTRIFFLIIFLVGIISMSIIKNKLNKEIETKYGGKSLYRQVRGKGLLNHDKEIMTKFFIRMGLLMFILIIVVCIVMIGANVLKIM